MAASDPRTLARAYGVLFVVTAGVAGALGVWDRLIVSDAAKASERLTAARIHIEQVTSLRRDTRKTHVALLESWLSPPDQRQDAGPKLERLLATVRAEYEEFRALPPTEDAETPIRERLTAAHEAWAELMAATLADRSAPRLAAHQGALAAVDREADAVLGVNSRAGEAVDQQIAALRTRQKFVEQGLVASLAAAIGLAILFAGRRRATERAREAKQREEARATELRGQFFANMSHELRTPLVAITNLTATFDEATSTPDSRRQFVKHVEQEAKDLLGMINNILDLAKLESAHADFLIEDISLADVLQRCNRRCAPLVGDKPVTIAVELADPKQRVRADFVKLQQVFTNLIANAVKFTDEGTVSVRVHPARLGKVAVDVADTGIGIEADALQAIWSAFRQADRRTSRKYGGTGLGLAIAKGVVDRLGGEVSVQSTVGKGTVFTVVLPAANDLATSNDAPSSSPPTSP
ncbi:MAG: HAMP domain-containing sensor histidine kinase [Polyangiaceae bacterium]